jgi:hypothetical protein
MEADNLTARLSWQALLAGWSDDRLPQSNSLQEICGVQSDSETVSYRLWVNFPFLIKLNSLRVSQNYAIRNWFKLTIN